VGAGDGAERTATGSLQALLSRTDVWQESDELRQVYATAQALGVGDYLLYDAGIVRGLDYYTGPVFEAYDRERFFRAILGGGRYDNLVAAVGGERISGVGFAMGDVIVELLLERLGKRPALATSPSRVLVTLFSADLYPQALDLAMAAGGRRASRQRWCWSRTGWESRSASPIEKASASWRSSAR